MQKNSLNIFLLSTREKGDVPPFDLDLVNNNFEIKDIVLVREYILECLNELKVGKFPVPDDINPINIKSSKGEYCHRIANNFYWIPPI